MFGPNDRYYFATSSRRRPLNGADAGRDSTHGGYVSADPPGQTWTRCWATMGEAVCELELLLSVQSGKSTVAAGVRAVGMLMDSSLAGAEER